MRIIVETSNSRYVPDLSRLRHLHYWRSVAVQWIDGVVESIIYVRTWTAANCQGRRRDTCIDTALLLMQTSIFTMTSRHDPVNRCIVTAAVAERLHFPIDFLPNSCSYTGICLFPSFASSIC